MNAKRSLLGILTAAALAPAVLSAQNRPGSQTIRDWPRGCDANIVAVQLDRNGNVRPRTTQPIVDVDGKVGDEGTIEYDARTGDVVLSLNGRLQFNSPLPPYVRQQQGRTVIDTRAIPANTRNANVQGIMQIGARDTYNTSSPANLSGGVEYCALKPFKVTLSRVPTITASGTSSTDIAVIRREFVRADSAVSEQIGYLRNNTDANVSDLRRQIADLRAIQEDLRAQMNAYERRNNEQDIAIEGLNRTEEPDRAGKHKGERRTRTLSASAPNGYFTIGVFAGPEKTSLTARDNFSVSGKTESTFYGPMAQMTKPFENGVFNLSAYAGKTSGTLTGDRINVRTGEIPNAELSGTDAGIDGRVEWYVTKGVGIGGNLAMRNVPTETDGRSASQMRFDVGGQLLLGKPGANVAVGAMYNTNGANATEGQRNSGTYFISGTLDGMLTGKAPLSAHAEIYRNSSSPEGETPYSREGAKIDVLARIAKMGKAYIALVGSAFYDTEEKFGQDAKRSGVRGGIAAHIPFK